MHRFVRLLLLLAPLLAIATLAGCSSGSGGRPFEGQQLNVFNWDGYIDPALIAEFQEKTGCTIQYDNYSSDEEMMSRLTTGGGGYDVVFPSDLSCPRLIRRGLLMELDHSLLPNWKHLDRQYLGRRHDPKNRYTVPYFWGVMAVGINSKHVKGEVKGFEALFDERYAGRITMLDDKVHAVAAALLHLGLPMNSTDDAHLAQARELLIRQKPLVQAYTKDDYKRRLAEGEAWVSLGWNGDLAQARRQEPAIKVVIPEKGTLIWVDSMVVLKDSPNPELAHAFINFLLDPAVAVRNARKVRYATPNKTARQRMDADLLNDPAVYPPEEVLERCHWLEDRGQGIVKIEELWRAVKQ